MVSGREPVTVSEMSGSRVPRRPRRVPTWATETWPRSAPGAHVGAVRGLLLGSGGADDQRDRARVRAEAGDEHAARRGRLAQRDQRGRLVGRPPRERVDDAEDRAEHEPGDRQPPERDDRAAPAGEVDLALLIGVRRSSACGA